MAKKLVWSALFAFHYPVVGKSFLVLAKCIREKFLDPWQNIYPCKNHHWKWVWVTTNRSRLEPLFPKNLIVSFEHNPGSEWMWALYPESPQTHNEMSIHLMGLGDFRGLHQGNTLISGWQNGTKPRFRVATPIKVAKPNRVRNQGSLIKILPSIQI